MSPDESDDGVNYHVTSRIEIVLRSFGQRIAGRDVRVGMPFETFPAFKDEQ